MPTNPFDPRDDAQGPQNALQAIPPSEAPESPAEPSEARSGVPDAPALPQSPDLQSDPSGATSFSAYVQERGLRAHIGPLGLEFLARNRVAARLGHDPQSAGIRIPYYDLKGEPIVDAGAAYERIRLLTPRQKSGKYRQRGGSLPHAYFCPLRHDWADVAADPARPLIFTEGELKAARAALDPTFPATVGLGGVESWSGGRAGTPLLPELQNWDWRNRTAYVVFDADNGFDGYKPSVEAAIGRFASALNELGAIPKILHLGRAGRSNPKLPADGKIGLDDYILAGGTWRDLLLTAEDAKGDDALRRLLVRFAVNMTTGRIVDLQTGSAFNPATFLTSVAAKYLLPSDPKPRPAGPLFLASERRTEIHSVGVWVNHPTGLVRIPLPEAEGEPPTDEPEGDVPQVLVLNQFTPPPGWTRSTEPSPEWRTEQLRTITDWASFVTAFFDAEPGLAELFHNWVTNAVRFPHRRNHTSWILQSSQQGVGKSLLGNVIVGMVGKQLGCGGGPDAFATQWNHYLTNKIFVLLDEVQDESGFHRSFKAYRTAPKLTINRKFQDSAPTANLANFIITTNESTPYRMEKDSRRDIVYTPHKLANDAAWQGFLKTAIVPLLTDTHRLRHLLEWYRHDRPLPEDYNHAAPAPMTDAKREVEEASRSNAEATAHEFAAVLRSREMLPAVFSIPAMNRIVPDHGIVVRKRLAQHFFPGQVFSARVYDAQGKQVRVTVLGMTAPDFSKLSDATKRELMERTEAKLLEIPLIEA